VGAYRCGLCSDQVATAIIVKGHMQGLMDVADPMPQAFEEPKLVANVEAQSKVPCVIQDGGNDAAIGNRARMRNLDVFRRARQVHIMLGRSLAREHIRPRASVANVRNLGLIATSASTRALISGFSSSDGVD